MLKKKEQIGLALSGGAARGYSQIPVIQKIIDEKIKIDIISGSSVGALIGAYFALHGEIDSLIEKLKKRKWTEWLKLIDLNNPKKSLIKGVKIRQFLEKEFFQDKEFSNTKIKLIVVATNIENNKPIYFTSGKIVDAVMYSLAIPGVFPLGKYKNKYLTDGQISEHLPVAILEKKGMTKIIGVDVIKNIKVDINEIKNSSISLLLSIFYRSLITSQIVESKNIFIFAPEFKKSDTKIGNNLRFDKIKANFLPGEKIVEREWKNFEKWLKK